MGDLTYTELLDELERARREINFLRQQLSALNNNANKFLAGREWRTNGDNLQKPYRA